MPPLLVALGVVAGLGWLVTGVWLIAQLGRALLLVHPPDSEGRQADLKPAPTRKVTVAGYYGCRRPMPARWG